MENMPPTDSVILCLNFLNQKLECLDGLLRSHCSSHCVFISSYWPT